MASITSPGIGSGLDVQGIVEKLVAAEGSPISARLDRQEAKAQAGLSAMGTFKSALAEFQSSLKSLRESQNFQSMTASSDNEDVLTVTATEKAQPGGYEIEVNQLAESQRLTSVLFDSDQEPIGGGTLQIQFGRYDEDANSFRANVDKIPQTITITEDRSTLRDIQRNINEADLGIRASVIKDDIGYRLVLSSAVTGEKNSLRITVEDNDVENSNLAGLSLFSFNPELDDGQGRNMVEMQQAIDAEVEIDGITIHSSANTVTESIDGLTLDLKDTGDADVNVFINKTEVVDRIRYFVEQYNKLIDTVDSLTGYDPETRQAGPLNGDSTVRSVSNQLRRVIGTPFSNINKEYVTLATIGLRTQFDGKLSLDEAKINRAMEEDVLQVVNLFANSGSVSERGLRFIEAGERTAMGSYEVNITQKPTKGGYASLQTNKFPIEIDEGNDEFKIKVDGIEANPIKLINKTYATGSDLANEMQSQINADAKLKANDSRVRVSYFDKRIIIVSERFGGGSKVEMLSADFDSARELGLASGPGQPGKDVQGTFGNFRALGVGAVLTGQQDVDGLKVEVSGGIEGPRGKVTYSRGVAAQLDDLVEQILASQGSLKPRMEGFNARIDDVSEQRERLALKLEKTERRYLKQFTELDALIGKMSSTGNFLTSQLGSLPGASSAGKK